MNMSIMYRIVLIFIPLFLFTISVAEASMLTFVRDLITTSAKNTGANHTIQFTATTPIPPSGFIEIRFHEGGFTIPGSFDFQDIDIAVSSGGPFVDRTLSSSANAVNDGISVVSGTEGSIMIELNSVSGISTGEVVRVTLGSNASFGVAGDTQIINPNTTGAYRIAIETFNQVSA